MIEKIIVINDEKIVLSFASDGRLHKNGNNILELVGHKYCGRCKEIKPLDSFQIVKGKHRPYCADCNRTAGREAFKRKYVKTATGLKSRFFNFKKLLASHLGGKCCLCGYNQFVTALEYHHVKKRQYTIPELSRPIMATFNGTRRKNAQSLADELSKCILCCANCHSAIHGGQLTIDKKELESMMITISVDDIVKFADLIDSAEFQNSPINRLLKLAP